MELPGTTEQGLTALTLLVTLSPTLATYISLTGRGREDNVGQWWTHKVCIYVL